MTLKNKILYFVIFPSLLLLSNCKNESNIDDSSIDSDIQTYSSGIVTIFGKTNQPNEGYSFELASQYGNKRIEFDSLEFQEYLEIDEPQIIGIQKYSGFSIPIYIIPGDSIIIEFKYNDVISEKQYQKYSGDRIKENELLAKLNSEINLDNIYLNSRIYAKNESQFIQHLDSLENIGVKFLAEFNKKERNKDVHFNILYDIFLRARLGKYLTKYPHIYQHSLKKGKIVLSENYYKRKKELIDSDPKSLNVNLYTNLIVNEIDLKIGIASDPSIKFPMIDSMFVKKEINQYLKFRAVIDEMQKFKFIRFLSYEIQENQSDTPVIGGRSNLIEDSKIELEIEKYKSTNPPRRYLTVIQNELAIVKSNN